MTLERRGGRRYTAEELSDEVRGRIRPGHHVRLLNLSARGALVETDRRLLPGTFVDVQLACGDARHQSRARVVRSRVGALLPQPLIFEGALELETPVPWPLERQFPSGSSRDICERGNCVPENNWLSDSSDRAK